MTRRNDGLTTGMSNADRLRALRADAMKHGLCQECRCREPREGVKTCDVCLQRAADRTTEHRLRGRCDCGKRVVSGKAHCQRCIDALIRRDRLCKERRVAQGLCPQCGKSAPESDRTRCRPCLDKAAAYKRYWWREIRTAT